MQRLWPRGKQERGLKRSSPERINARTPAIGGSGLRPDPQQRLPAIDIEIEKNKVWERCLELYPDREELYEMIYESRFQAFGTSFKASQRTCSFFKRFALHYSLIDDYLAEPRRFGDTLVGLTS